MAEAIEDAIILATKHCLGTVDSSEAAMWATVVETLSQALVRLR